MTFLSKSRSSLNVVNISWAMSMRRCFCSKFSNFETIYATARFMPKTNVKSPWDEPDDMPTLLKTSLIVIRRLSKIIFFNGCWRARATRTSIVIDIFSVFLKTVTSQLNLCSANSRLAKRHNQHFECPCTQNLIQFLWSIFSNSKK